MDGWMNEWAEKGGKELKTDSNIFMNRRSNASEVISLL